MEVIKVCLKYNRVFINIVSIIASIAIVALLSIGIDKIRANIMLSNNEEKVEIINNVTEKKEIENVVKEERIEKTSDEKLEEIENKVNDNLENGTEDSLTENDVFDWYIEIPKIKLYAPIEDGTDDEVLNRSVGHFENTSRRNGNCGLAAHNRGYRVNYFAKLKELEKGDIIYYFVDGKKYEYKVSEIAIIYETDWSMLEDTEDDRITLITCVENRDEYRLCIQGVLADK